MNVRGESYLVADPEDMPSGDVAHLMPPVVRFGVFGRMWNSNVVLDHFSFIRLRS